MSFPAEEQRKAIVSLNEELAALSRWSMWNLLRLNPFKIWVMLVGTPSERVVTGNRAGVYKSWRIFRCL